MNFLAHGEVARRLPGGGTEFTLGAMLPDLTHMLEFQVRPDRLPFAIRAGWSCHVATDRWFHADERFRSAVKEMSSALVGVGWRRWPAQAASHASWELLLDGQLAHSSDPSSWFEETLRCASFRGTLDAAEQSSWDRLVEAQARRPLWRSYLDADGVADRTWRRLSRTRLAFPPDAIVGLTALLEAQREVIGPMAEGLVRSAVDSVSFAIETSEPTPRAPAID
jgi:hypothetical protein